MTGRQLHVTFICHGNICRSPMAANMFAHQIRERGLEDRVRVSSAGTHGWRHARQGAHRDTVRVLQEHGYPTEHRAAQVDRDHAFADLVVVMDRRNAIYVTETWGKLQPRVRLLRSFSPSCPDPAPDVVNPWGRPLAAFGECFDVIESALPGVHQWVDQVSN